MNFHRPAKRPFLWALLLAQVLLLRPAWAATISTFHPSLGPAGTQITVAGSGFLGTTNVQLGDLFADFTVLAHDRLLVVVPPLPMTGLLRVGSPSGGAVSAGNFLAPPRITSFFPGRSGTNTAVTIDGANFMGATQVQFGGSNAVFFVTASSQIHATVPAGAPSGPIRVVSQAGEGLSPVPFTVSSPAPIIDAVVPPIGAPGSPVRLEGVNFIGANRVTFNGVAAAFAVTAGTQIEATVPSSATTGPVAVTTPKGSGTNSAGFVVTRAPVVTDFRPDIGVVGTPVIIEGINFTGVTGVSFNGKPVSGIGTPALGQLQVNVPSGATTGPIRVTNSFGVGVSARNFVVTAAPIIDDFWPLMGAPGASVVINGANFVQNATTVKFNGRTATSAVTALTQVHATVPSGATSGPISIHNASGSITSTVPFMVIGSPPVVTDFDPARGPRGTPIIISGLNFTNVTAVTFNGTNAERFSATAPTQIHAVVPATVTTGPIKVTTTAGSYTTSNLFHAPPRVTGFAPEQGWAGDPVTITGTNLAAATAVAFGGVEWPFEVVDARTLRASVPTQAAGGTLALTTPGGAFISTNAFAVLPRILEVAPLLGPAGTVVTLHGSGFFNISAVRFGGAEAPYELVSSTEIRATVPASAVTGPILVETAAGTATSPQVFQMTGSSDLAVSMSATPAVIQPGAQVEFRMLLENRGLALLSEVRLTNTLPLGLVFVSASAGVGEVATVGQVTTLKLATLAHGASVVLDVVATAPGEGSYTNLASVQAAEADPNAFNNGALATVAVAAESARLLRIRRLAGASQVVLSWPTSAIPFVLQVSTNLIDAGAWSTAPGSPAVSAGEMRQTNAVLGTVRFYRLRY